LLIQPLAQNPEAERQVIGQFAEDFHFRGIEGARFGVEEGQGAQHDVACAQRQGT